MVLESACHKKTNKMVATGMLKQVEVWGWGSGMVIREMWNHTMEVLEQVT